MMLKEKDHPPKKNDYPKKMIRIMSFLPSLEQLLKNQFLKIKFHAEIKTLKPSHIC